MARSEAVNVGYTHKFWMMMRRILGFLTKILIFCNLCFRSYHHFNPSWFMSSLQHHFCLAFTYMGPMSSTTVLWVVNGDFSSLFYQWKNWLDQVNSWAMDHYYCIAYIRTYHRSPSWFKPRITRLSLGTSRVGTREHNMLCTIVSIGIAIIPAAPQDP